MLWEDWLDMGCGDLSCDLLAKKIRVRDGTLCVAIATKLEPDVWDILVHFYYLQLWAAHASLRKKRKCLFHTMFKLEVSVQGRPSSRFCAGTPLHSLPFQGGTSEHLLLRAD